MAEPRLLKAFIEAGDVPFTEGASSFIFTCPRCNKERKLYIRKRDGRFVCFRCREDSNFQGKRTEFALAELYNISIDQAVEQIYPNFDIALKSYLELKLVNPYDDNEEIIEEDELLGISMPSEFVGIESDKSIKGISYMISRGVGVDLFDKYDLKYNPKWRTVVFPVYMGGTLVGWQERGTDSDFKYTLNGFKKEKTLMFYDRSDADHVILCEGPVDAIKADLCGGAVSSMGKGVSPKQLDLIKQKTRKLYLALDPDASKEFDSICRSMYDYMDSIYVLTTPKGRKDLGASTFEEVYEQFQKAEKYTGRIFMFLRGFNG